MEENWTKQGVSVKSHCFEFRETDLKRFENDLESLRKSGVLCDALNKTTKTPF